MGLLYIIVAYNSRRKHFANCVAWRVTYSVDVKKINRFSENYQNFVVSSRKVYHVVRHDLLHAYSI